jgi:hypothetical protein
MRRGKKAQLEKKRAVEVAEMDEQWKVWGFKVRRTESDSRKAVDSPWTEPSPRKGQVAEQTEPIPYATISEVSQRTEPGPKMGLASVVPTPGPAMGAQTSDGIPHKSRCEALLRAALISFGRNTP